MVLNLEMIPLFHDVDEEYMALLRPLFGHASFRMGETVIEQGADVDFIYLIERGLVEISYKPYDGTAITVSHVDVGGIFGWSALVGSAKYTSSAIAVTDLDVIRLHGNDLRNLCMKNPEAGRVILDRLASAVSSRWQDAHEQIKSILSSGINGNEKCPEGR